MAHPTDLASRPDNEVYAQAVQEIEDDIAGLSQEVKDLVFGRFFSTFHDGVYDPVEGRTYLKTVGTTEENSCKLAIFADTKTTVQADQQKAKQILALFRNNAQIHLHTIHSKYYALSAFARKEIEQHLLVIAQTTPENATSAQFKDAIEALDRKLQ